MGTVSTFALDPDAAWQRYEALAKAALADPRLMTDRRHIEATLRAHRAFCDAFNRQEVASG